MNKISLNRVRLLLVRRSFCLSKLAKISGFKDTQIWACNMRTGRFKSRQTEADNEQLRKKGRQKLRRGYATAAAKTQLGMTHIANLESP
jgi:hypothetical protein